LAILFYTLRLDRNYVVRFLIGARYLFLLVLQPTVTVEKFINRDFICSSLDRVITWIYGTRSLMSSNIASKKRLEKHSDWAFDITTQFQASSDEDSESDSDQKLVTTNNGAAGLLIDDLDLSKREDNAAYNPNPFSIAKTNAAYRRQTTTATTFEPIQPVITLDQNPAATNSGAGRLLIDDLDLSKLEDDATYNPNPFRIAKTNAGYRHPATTVEPIQPVRLSDQKPATTRTGAAGLLINGLDLSEPGDNGAYNPKFISISKMNAVCRPQSSSTVNSPVVQATQSVRLASKPAQTQKLTKRSRTDSNQTTIMEGFKTQAMKKPRINNALHLRVPPLLPTVNPISPSKPAVKKSSTGLFPSPLLIPSPSTKPISHLAKMRVPDDSTSGFMQVKSYPKRDAYQYSTKDVDEEWTTLPSKKKSRRPKFSFSFFSHIPTCVNVFLEGIRLSASRFIYKASAYHQR
jgi:hypothetical protein